MGTKSVSSFTPSLNLAPNFGGPCGNRTVSWRESVPNFCSALTRKPSDSIFNQLCEKRMLVTYTTRRWPYSCQGLEVNGVFHYLVCSMDQILCHAGFWLRRKPCETGAYTAFPQPDKSEYPSDCVDFCKFCRQDLIDRFRCIFSAHLEFAGNFHNVSILHT